MSINTYKLIDVLKGTEGLGEDDALYLPPGPWEKKLHLLLGMSMMSMMSMMSTRR
ncbi:hypothetical protein ACU8V3_14175 [Cobetia marina]